MSNGSSMKARVLVVDDHPILRRGLMELIAMQKDLTCCGEASTTAETEAAVARLRPDLLILDLRLKNGDTLELIKSLTPRFPKLRILVLSQYDAPLYVERALRAGALGYVVKEQAADEMLTAIRTVLAGEVYLMRSMAARLLHEFVGLSSKGGRAGIEMLSDRELQVLQLLGTGMSTREVAQAMNLSFKTIETHRENIKSKLGLTGAAQLIHYASKWANEGVSVPPRVLASGAFPKTDPPLAQAPLGRKTRNGGNGRSLAGLSGA